MSLRVVVSAGEVSGDKHLARVIPYLKSKSSGCEVKGMAGRECAAAGVELLVDCYKSGATMGFGDVLKSAGKIYNSYRTMSKLIREWKPDIVVLVDYPDFNMRLAKVAREVGSKILYFIPPKVWAWRSGRVEKMKLYVDRIAAIFPFEPAFYQARGYDQVTYVGHPLGDLIAEVPEEREQSLLMLPGSRRSEVERILPPMLRVFERLLERKPQLRGRVVVAPNMSAEWLLELARGCVREATVNAIEWTQGDSLTEMRRAQAGILKSGTCNLEGAVAGLPFVSVYSGSNISKVIASALVPLTEYSPVNIMRSKTVKEVFGVTIDEAALEQEVFSLLEAGEVRSDMVKGLAEVRKSLTVPSGALGGSSVPERVAQLIVDTVKGVQTRRVIGSHV